MNDPTEDIRREMVEEINAEPGSRDALEAEHGQVFDTAEMRERFTVNGFMAPFVGVMEKATGKRGCLLFQHSPRFYYGFVENREE